MNYATVDPYKYLDAYPSALKAKLPACFVQLSHHDEDPSFLHKFARAIKLKISVNFQNGGFFGFDGFATVALQCGLVKSFMSLSQLDATDRDRGSAAYHAGDTFARLIPTGNIHQRRQLLKELLDLDIIEVLLKKINHPLCIERQQAANVMRTLAAEAFLAQAIGPQRCAEIIEQYCYHNLSSHEPFVKQLTSPELSWQNEIAIGRELTLEQARKYAPRYFALSQENCMWIAHAFLCQDPLASHRFRLDLLKHKPQVIDLLAQCGTLPIQAWYPENQHDSIACEALSLLFMNSVDHVSGIPIRLKDSLQVEDDAEHDAFNESLEILFSRDNWVELLVSIWKRLDDEKLEDVARMFKRVTKDHIPTKTPDEMSFNCVFEYRGISRTCVLRLIALATYTSNPALISDTDLFALLRLAYLGCQRTRAAKPVELFTSQQDLWANLEIRYDIMRDPLYSVSLPVSTEPVQVVPQMLVMAPIALVRILTLIAQRGLLDKIPHWRKLPEGCSKSVSLVQVMQMTGLSVVEKSLKAAMKAVAPRREMGTKFMKEGNLDWAASTYASSAELAAAILAFDEATDGKWSHHLAGAREEIVKSLGNASEMAFQRRKYRRALRFATGAVSIAEAAPSSKPINPALVTKNKRRMEASSAQMKA